ncbi:Signal transduction histidine kinase [Paenibacillus sp. UNCCL117]|uniref:sensor histidine kinase n=1 Tax=unclassified Paenibacillus TaxID=185978 RepID=UPI0008914311|nr:MULTISPECIES: HAMP domain-containing sensor histidine kinase [unclassified Paenibacillus]SDE51391.1 Signal transduction histidine kinase [Paenibacillus sp. cl123]SFW67158.1 Signal transduction histidine kinase [Paenibacillus sp. UNCCL117]
MSIRLRLVLSYIAMLIVPLVLSVLAVILIGIATLGSLKSVFQVNYSEGSPFKRIIEQEAELSVYIKAASEANPDQFLDAFFLSQLEERLHQINMGLIIRKDQAITHMSSYIKPDQVPDISQLPPYGAYGASATKFKHNQGPLWISRQQDFIFSDQSKGSAFIFLDGSPFQKYLHQFSTSVIVAFIVILVLTNGALTYLVSRSIIRPLRALKRAAEEIKDGNLDFEVIPQTDDEIGQLSRAFEDMRRRLKQSVELQLQYEENRKELISNISHDLKTPVTAIKGYVEGIMDGVTNSPEKLDRYVRTIYNKTTDMDRLIDELFLFSKLDLGKVPFQFERLDLVDYIRDCAQELAFDMEKKGVTFLFSELPSGPLPVTADREKLKRVLLNVIGNAEKYCDKANCTIRLTVREMDGKAVVCIEDNGQGISEEELPHIFDRFYRADPSRNTSTGGSGLGLAIAKQIMEEHKGQISAASTLGQGTTVCLTLPLHTTEKGGESE